jgi:hypothetical protein
MEFIKKISRSSATTLENVEEKMDKYSSSDRDVVTLKAKHHDFRRHERLDN